MKKDLGFYLVFISLCLYSLSLYALPQGAIARLGRGLVVDVAFSPDGSKLAVLTYTGLYFHNPANFAELAFIELNELQSVIAFSPDGNLLTYGYDGTIRIYDTKTYTEVARLKVKDEPKKDLYAISFSPDGRLIAFGLGDGSVRLFDIKEGKEFAKLRGHSKPVISVSFSSDGTLMATGDEKIILWNLAALEEIHEFKGHDFIVNSLSFSSDSKFLASGDGSGVVKLWDVERREEIVTLEQRSSSTNSLAFSPDGSILACGHSQGLIRFFDIRLLKEILEFDAHSLSADSIQFSGDGSLLVGSSGDRVILLDVKNMEEMGTTNEYMYGVNTLACSPIRIYDASGRLIRTLNIGYQLAGFYITKDKAAYWDGRNEAGEHVASGIYFYNIQAGDFTAKKKMIISR